MLVPYNKTALILIDLQNDFCHPNGTASERGNNVHAFQDTFKNITTLLKAARESNTPIIHAISEHSDWSESPSKKERFGREEQVDELSYCELNSWGAEIYHLFKPESTEKIIIKHRYSAFLHTDLEFILKANNIESIVLVGLYTNVCIDSTARDGYMRDFQVTIPYDCVASNDIKKHKYALHLVKGTFSEVIQSTEVIEQWK